MGLAGEAIPIGARILSAVDCLDALASDRQYRKALPLNEAMAKVVADAGKALIRASSKFLHRRYIELEKLAHEQPLETPAKLSTDIKVERGSAPAAGFAASEEVDEAPANVTTDSRALIAAAQRAGQEIIELEPPARDSASRGRHFFSAVGALETSGAARLHGGLLSEGRRAGSGSL